MQLTFCHPRCCSCFGAVQGHHSNHAQQNNMLQVPVIWVVPALRRAACEIMCWCPCVSKVSNRLLLQYCRVASREPALVLCRVAQRRSRLIEGEQHWAVRAACQAGAMQGCLWSEKVPMGVHACNMLHHVSRSCSHIGAMQGHLGTGQPATHQAVRPYLSNKFLLSAAAWHGARKGP